MQECEGCWVSTWYTALRPGEGLQSLLWLPYTAQLGRAGRKRILGVIRWKQDHQGNTNAFLGSGQIIQHLRVCCLILQRTSQNKHSSGSALERHSPTSSAAAQLGAKWSQIITVRWKKINNNNCNENLTTSLCGYSCANTDRFLFVGYLRHLRGTQDRC